MGATKNRKSKILAIAIFTVAVLGLAVFLFSGENFKLVLSVVKGDFDIEEYEGFGIRGNITIAILSMLQVILTFVPAEPVQVISGLMFGFLEGGLVCLIGLAAGNTVIYFLYKRNATRLTEWFECNADFDFNQAKNSYGVEIIIFVLYLLPAIPYGLICIFAASLGMKYHKYLILTVLGAIPSVAIGVGLGHMAGAASWVLSLCVFITVIILLIIVYKKKDYLFQKLNDYMKSRKKNSVRKCNAFVLNTADFCAKLALGRKVKVNLVNKVGKLERPSIVLSTHGSFLDFVFTGRILKKERPHFVAARLYFYHKIVGKLLRSIGAFPKSMFSSDIENAGNCLKVIANGEVLAMMPEARLSTIGRFEGIQESTFKFIKKMGVPVYVVNLEGDYFAKPKWGDKARKGSVVNATLDLLLTKEQVETLSVEEFKQKIETALYYDEFKWLETMPEIHYKSKTLAVGLENILTTCPTCGAKYQMVTDKMSISCQKCNFTATLNDRYGFVDNKPFNNFAEWYDWQKAEMEKQMLSDDTFKLESKVELRHSSKDGKHCTRKSGDGVCVFDKTGLTYKGTRDGEEVTKFFPLKDIFRLLFGAGEDFEIYEGKEIWYFVPENKRSCVDYYIASELFKKHFE